MTDSAGRLIPNLSQADFQIFENNIEQQLQTLYSVSYNPADKNYDGQWRNVGVKVKQGAAMARTKRGFYAR